MRWLFGFGGRRCESRTVAYLANSSWYLWNFRRNTFRKSLDLGFKVVLISPSADEYSERLSEMGCEVRHSPLSPAGKNPIVELACFIGIFLILFRLRPHLVFSFTPKVNIYSGLTCRVLGLRFVPNISGLGVGISKGDWFSFFMKLLFRLSLRRSEHIFFQNDSDRDMFGSLGVISMNSTSILPGSGVDTQVFFPVEGLDYSDEVRFVFSGRLLLEKGILDFMDASAIMKKEFGHQVSFDVWGKVQEGRGLSMSDFTKIAERCSVNYRGSSDEMCEELKGYHCIVLPSFYGEGVPRCLLEGMATGLGIITTDMPGCKTVVREGVNGFFATAKSVTSICTAMRKYVNLSIAEKRDFSIASREIAVNLFDEKLAIRPYEELLSLAL